MKTSCAKLWWTAVVFYWILLFVGRTCALETKLQLFPNVSSTALVPRTGSGKLIAIDKTCPFLFLELLDGSVELVDAIKGSHLWSIKSQKIFLPNKEDQPSILDRCILGPDYRLYLLQEDGMVPYFLGNSESLLTLYRVDTSALFIELDTGKVLKEMEFDSEQDSSLISCIEGKDDTCSSLWSQYGQVKNIGIVFRKFVGIRMYDAASGKSYFANFSRFEPSNYIFRDENSLHTISEDRLWYGKLVIDTRQVSLRDTQDQQIWSRTLETPVIHMIALSDMFQKERKGEHKDWISFSSLEMISDVPYNGAWNDNQQQQQSIGMHFISFFHPVFKQNVIILLCLIVVFCIVILYYRRAWTSIHSQPSSWKTTSHLLGTKNGKDIQAYMYSNSPSNTEEYKIGKLIVTNHVLGVGSHGTVVLEGRLDGDGRKVAVKRMLKTFYELARREIEMLIALDELSPFVVRYYAMEEDNLFIYLALELCDRSLEEQVQIWKDSTELSSRCFVPILRQIIQGLMDLHRHGVVHRDLKPQNILVLEPKQQSPKERLYSLEYYRIKIADVGLAKKMTRETTFSMNGSFTSNKAEGSCGWRAAEVLNKQKQNTCLDIFAAGCLFYFVLTRGKHPFGESLYERESKICKGDYNLTELEKLHLWDAKDLIEKMIELDPFKRPCAKQVLQHPFFWTDTKKLSFLADVSDRLSFFKSSSRQGKDLVVAFEKHCRVILQNITMETNDKRISWASKIDTSVLIAPNSRNYDTTSISDLLRLIRNKRSHYNELSISVQRILGKLPSYDDREDNFNFWQYFHSRFPKLFITVYTFVIERPEFLEDTHFRGYGLRQRKSSIDNQNNRDKELTEKHRNDWMSMTPTTITRLEERRQYSIEQLLQLNHSMLPDEQVH